MNVFALDTDTLSLVRHHHPVVLNAIDSARDDGHAVSITIVSIEEQASGWLAAIRKAKTDADEARFSQAFADAVPVWATFQILPRTEAAIARFEQLKRQKLNVGRMDLRIAAIALEAGATVVTRNLRDFQRVAGLTVVDWSVA